LSIKRKVHVRHEYLGKKVLDTPRIKDGDEVELEVRDGEVIIRPVKGVDKDTLDLVRLLREVKAGGSREDYFREYDYEDISG